MVKANNNHQKKKSTFDHYARYDTRHFKFKTPSSKFQHWASQCSRPERTLKGQYSTGNSKRCVSLNTLEQAIVIDWISLVRGSLTITEPYYWPSYAWTTSANSKAFHSSYVLKRHKEGAQEEVQPHAGSWQVITWPVFEIIRPISSKTH